ncbi:MAG: nucleotidyltransferase domain-containing protein [Patescibacteria group bacterium]
MSKKLIEKEIQNITQQLIKKYKPEKIILFGSAAQGKFGPDSDLDFAIIKGDVPLNNIERRWQVRRLIRKSLPADFLVYRPEEFETCLKMGDPFVKTIQKEGRILYG